MVAKLRFSTSLLLLMAASASATPLVDTPVIWWEEAGEPIARPAEREPNLLWDMTEDTVVLPLRRFTDPGRILRRLGPGDQAPPAADVNALDEVVNSSWFTNRIGLFPLSLEDAARGSGAGLGPDRGGPWTVIAAKSEGVTPGFTIRDATGQGYLIKFDPPGHLGMTSAAGVVSGRILHAAGYNVPDDNLVLFERERLVLGEGVRLKLADGSRREMDRADLDAILDPLEKLSDGRLVAISSRWVSGKPIGPFDYLGRRDDDGNDRIKHQHRRELRGLRFFAAWLNHFDTKQANSLDSWEPVADGETGFVKHYLIDFASTLGLGAGGPSPLFGREFGFDLPWFLRRVFTLGLSEDPWRSLAPPSWAPGLGYWSAESFDPWAFRSQQPNSAFANCGARDAYWAAKIISAFTDEHLAAIVAAAGYRDAEAAAHVARVLGERRDIIARDIFAETPPLDFFTRVEGVILWRDLGVERGLWPAGGTRYRARLSSVDAERRVIERGEWLELRTPDVALSALPGFAAGKAGAPPFVSIECRVDRGEGWSDSVTAFMSRASGRIVALDR
jgi:hypothetical protein